MNILFAINTSQYNIDERDYSFLAFLGLWQFLTIMGVQSVMDTTFRPPIVKPFTAD